jgi:glycosyltransferase involved in cell wall biosynthesis
MQVSVIIPTYNSAGYLTDAVDSVFEQTFNDVELLVIDDGSTDNTEAVMRRYGSQVRYIRQSNGGVAAARNRGIVESRGRWIAFLDADDTWLAGKLERQLAALADSAEGRACYSAFALVDTQLAPLGVNRSERHGTALEDLLLRGNVIGTPSTVVCDRALFDLAGGFDTTLSQCADWDMWIRLAAFTDFIYVDEPLAKYRQHPNNMSRNVELLERDSVRMLEKGFDMAGVPCSLRSLRRATLARNYMVLAGSYFHARNYQNSMRCAARAIALDFRQLGRLAGFPMRAAARYRSGRSAEAL